MVTEQELKAWSLDTTSAFFPQPASRTQHRAHGKDGAEAVERVITGLT